jgi:hypothetical protein
MLACGVVVGIDDQYRFIRSFPISHPDGAWPANTTT